MARPKKLQVNFLPDPTTLDAMSRSHRIFAKQPGGGIEQILRGRRHAHEVMFVQAAYPRLSPELNIVLLPFQWVLLLCAATQGDVGPTPSAPRGFTTVLLLPRRPNDDIGEGRLGEWTVSRSATSIAIFVEQRAIEPCNLEAFLDAAWSIYEQHVAGGLAPD